MNTTKMIETANMKIDPEVCKRLDHAIYFTAAAKPAAVISKAAVIRAELLALIGTYVPSLADSQKDCTLYRLCCWVERVQSDFAKKDGERGRANMQTAHNQLKNWK